MGDEYMKPERVKAREEWEILMQSSLETTRPCTLLTHIDYMHKLRQIFPNSRILRGLDYKLRNIKSRAFKNTLYNILTGYGHYKPPLELEVPANCYFNPYAKNMITSVPPFLKDKGIEYADGVPASIPQMAYDLTEFLAFLRYGKRSDWKVEALV
jgi:hypothetical protein